MSVDRRSTLKALLGLGFVARTAAGEEYASAGAALDAIEGRSESVEAVLRALRGESEPLRKGFSSFLEDYRRHRQDRAALRRTFGIPPAREARPEPKAVTLRDLRAAVQELVFAHAEGIPALGSGRAVTVIGGHLLDVARHLAIVDLWLEPEAGLG